MDECQRLKHHKCIKTRKRIDEFRIVIKNGKAASRRRTRKVNTECNGAHCSHGDEIEEVESSIEPILSGSAGIDTRSRDSLEPCTELELVSVRSRCAMPWSMCRPIWHAMLRINVSACGGDCGTRRKATESV